MIQKAADEVRQYEEEHIQVPGKKKVFYRSKLMKKVQKKNFFSCSGLSPKRAGQDERIQHELDEPHCEEASVVQRGEKSH